MRDMYCEDDDVDGASPDVVPSTALVSQLSQALTFLRRLYTAGKPTTRSLMLDWKSRRMPDTGLYDFGEELEFQLC